MRCKMQSDSMQFSASGHIKEACNQAVTQQSLDKCFQCSKCVLIFKSKVYLFEHLNKVHGLDVEAALRGAGLKSAETYKASADKNSNSSGKCIKCQHCGFKACNLEVLNEHKKQCKKDLSGTLIVSEIPEIGINVTTSTQHNEAAEEMPSIVSVISLSEAQRTLGSQKDLKTYKRPSPTIPKYFARDSGSNGKPSAMVTGETEGTLILEDSPPSCSPNKDGVFRVIAKSKIDIDNRGSFSFLDYEHLFKPKENVEEPAHSNLGKRDKNESSKGPLPKKSKLEDEKAKIPESISPPTQPSSNAEFSFEVSDEEEENNDNRAPRKQKVYFCKHCDYSNVSFSDVSFHYQSNHPFVRCKAAYIHNPNVQSATFRCLTCPMDFESTIDLKWHYVEYHPEAPDIFKMKPAEFRLAFKCFQCPHTHTNAKDLRQHYKTNHPTFDVGNSLLFYRYSVTECQEEPPQLKTCEKTERSGEITPEKVNMPSKEAKNTSPQHPTPKGSDMALHQCSKCEFTHKSVVVMHVHYQKNHPDEALTIPKIKELTRIAPQSTSQSTPVKERCEKTEDKPEPSQPKKVSLSVPEHKPDASKNHSAAPETNKAKSAEDESKTKALPRKSIRESDRLSSNSPEQMYCQFCNYTSISLRSVVGHHCAKHSMIAQVSKEDIISYSAEVRKNKLESEAHLKTDEHVKVCSETKADGEQNDVADNSGTQESAYLHAEKLFYCQECNYGNRCVKGILDHQNKMHKIGKANSVAVREYTALIRDEIEKSKSLAQDSSSSTHLPLPFINEGDEEKFFCPLCNYRHSSIAELMRHCTLIHQGLKTKQDIRKYTSKVLKQDGKLQLTVVNQEVTPVETEEEKKKTLVKLVTTPADPAPASLQDSKPSLILQCYKCSYTAKYFYLLKNHLFKSHQSNRAVTDILRTYFRQGVIQSGYHCHRCGFTHEKATKVFKHFQQQHPKYKASFDFIKRRLYVGPDSVAPKRKNGQKKPPHRGDGSLATQISGQKETKLHVCSACSHKSGSKSDLERHYQAAHPGLSKEKGSDLQNGKKASAQSQANDLAEMPGLFEAFQVPLEDPEEVNSSSTEFKCASCPAHFSSDHGLITHCGMKGHNPLNGQEALKQQTQSQTRLHVFNCPYCAYINTTYQGVLAHCQIKHPRLNSRVESLHVDITNLRNQEKFKKKYQTGSTLKFSGFLCKTCPQFCKTLDKLNKHKVKHLIKTKPSTVTENLKKTTSETSAISTVKTDKSLNTQGSSSKALLLSKKALEKCAHCSFSCNTKIALKQHMFIQHKDVISKDFVRKCELCPRFYFSKVRLGRHYSKRHGKNAYLKYFASVYKQASKKSSSPDQPSTQQLQKDPAGAKKEVYKCLCCTYVNASPHGLLTHSQMKHPDVLVRAEGLEKMEILVANMIKCSLGKGSNERGYLCKKCPQIHASMTRLKIHCERDHKRKATSNLPAQTETQNQPGISARGSVLEAWASEKKTSEAIVRETVPSGSGIETGPSKSLTVEKKKVLYECQKCTYTAFHRKHLRCHYRSTHKLDARSTYKLMEKYNMYRCNYLPRCAEPDKRAKVRCKSCPDLVFNSSQLLIDHYNTHHSVVCKSDFIVISAGLKWKTTGMYKCAHCMTVLYGTKILRRHLERHKSNMVETAKGTKEAASSDGSATGPKSTKPSLDEAPPQQDVTSAETISSPPSPQLSPSKVTDVEPEAENKEERHTCKQCRRTFMSRRGLRSHESSHAATAAIKKDNLPTSQLSIYKYVLHKSGTTKPFRCGCCAYRTTVLGLWRSHFMKNHQDVVQKDDIETNNKEEITQWPSGGLLDTVEEVNTLPESEEELEETERSLYLEPPDVQRQLNQYSLMANTSDKSNETVQDSALAEAGLLHCEFCNFKTEHPSSIRRHYLSLHGKKILRCKDCSFFTGLQKTLEVHMETGHSTCQSEPTHQKDLRCPFCLYQTKNKNNMIDHIVLHREERVVPIEVRRPKLSRYLQGIVFRCHQCTFSSGSTENLRLHMMRHKDIKPYKCRLCYFDCTQLSDLEAHLNDKHQVLRNHELVGQVSLDQLEARMDISEKHEEHNNNGSDDAESEEYFTDCDEYPQTANLAENDGSEKVSTQAHEKDEQGKNEENPTKSSIVDTQYDNAGPTPSVHKDHGKDPQTQVEIAALHHTAEVQSVAEGNHPETQAEDCSGQEKEVQTNENQDEHKENPAHENAQDHKPHPKIPHHRILDIEARVEDDILDHILQLDGVGCMYKIHKRTDQMRTGKEEQNTEAQAIDLSLHKNEQNLKTQEETNSVSASPKKNKPKTPGCFTFERHLLTLSPNRVRLKLSHQDSSGVSFAICKREQKQSLINYKEATEPCTQTPGLENENVKKEVNCLKSVEQEETGHLEQKQDKEDDVNTETSSKDQDTPPVIKDVQPAAEGAAEVLNEENRFNCEYCGRIFTTISELDRHVMRHGM